MKKILVFALTIMVGATFLTANAAKKKNKKSDKLQNTITAIPSTDNELLSYASGKAATQGLIPFIQQQHHVDTAYMEDFIAGFREALSNKGNKAFTARIAGAQIAAMVGERILPMTKNEFVEAEDSINDQWFYNGFIAALKKDNTVFTDSAAQNYFESERKKIKEAQEAKAKAKNTAWLEENAKKEGVVVLPSGLQYKVITMGTGDKPKDTDEVEVKYEGKTIDGNVFDTSYKRNPQTTKFRANQVIKGWTEALLLMPVGSKWELYIPENLAYGARQAGQIKPFSTLIFTVELEGITPEKKTEETEPVKTETKATKTVTKKPVAKKKK